MWWFRDPLCGSISLEIGFLYLKFINKERKRMKSHIGARSAGSQNSDIRLPRH